MSSLQVSTGEEGVLFTSILRHTKIRDLSEIDILKVVGHWQANVYVAQPKKKPQTILEACIERFLDVKLVSGVSDKDLLRIFTTKVDTPGMPFKPEYAHRQVNILRVKNACSEIANCLGHSVGTPELAQYQQLVRILSALPINESSLIQRILEEKMGPITALAASVSAANVNFFMGKAKLSNAVPLFHQIFSNPTLMGKLNAIWKLLELYELIWEGVNWTLVSQIVQSIYSAFFFLVDKCKLAGNFIAQGFKWVKPEKVGEGEPDMQKQSAVLKGGADVLMGEDLAQGNDCLYEAIAPQIGQDPQILKRQFCEYIGNMSWEQANTVLMDNGITLEYLQPIYPPELRIETEEQVWDAIKLNAASNDMKDNITAIFISEFIHRNVVLEDSTTVLENKRQTEDQRPVFIRRVANCHFIPATPRTVTATNQSLASPREIIPLSCHMCQTPALSTCGLCAKNICLKCITLCCRTFDPIVKKEDGVVDMSAMPNPYDSDMESLSSFTSASSSNPSVPEIPKVVEEVPKVDTVIESKLDEIFEDHANKILKAKVENSKIKFNNPPKEPPTANKPPVESVFAEDSEETVWKRIKNFFTIANLNSVTAEIMAFFETVFGNVYTWVKDNPILIGLLTLIGSVSSLLGIGLPTVLNAGDKRSLITKFSEATKNVYYAQRMGTGILDSFKEFGNAIATVFGISTDAQVTEFKQRIVELNIEAQRYLSLAQTDPASIVNSTQEILKFKKKVADVEKAYLDLVKYSEKANLAVLAPIWAQLNKSYQTLTQLLVKYTNSMMERQEPVVLWVYGPTNHGKSRMINYIIDQLNERMQREMSVFTISKGPSYWNGYVGQSVIKIDDFGCWTGPEGNLDALHMFNLKTCAAYNPNMAGLDVKEIMATPKFVIIASNEPTIPLNTAIMDTKAFERRRDILLHVTWPEHDLCAETGNCEHIQKLREEYRTTQQEKYDHLHLYACEPNVSTYYQKGPKTVRVIDKKKIVEERVNLEQVIQTLLDLEKVFEEQFRVSTLRRFKLRKQATVERFDRYPNIILSGPPGTSKSYIMDQVLKSQSQRTHHVKTKAQFEAFCAGGYKPPEGTTMVVFDDLSTWTDMPEMTGFLKHYKVRADEVSEETVLWCMGVNPQVLRPSLSRAFLDPSQQQDDTSIVEVEDMFYRRATVIETKFKKRPFSLKALFKTPKFYCAQDLQGENKVPIDQAVQFRIIGEKDPRGQSTIINWICNQSCVIETVQTIDKLPPALPMKPDCSASLDITCDELLHLICNAPLTQVLSFVTSDKVRVESGSLNKATILEKIKKTVLTAKAHAGCIFNSLEEFWLVCSNEKYLAHFDNLRCYIILRDGAFSIENGSFDYPVVHSLDQGMLDQAGIITELQKIQKTVSTAEFLTFSSTQFSPWFCFVGDIVVQAVKMFATFGSISASIADNNKAVQAVKLFDSVNLAANNYVENEIGAIKTEFEGKMAIGNQKRHQYMIALDNKDNDPYAKDRVSVTLEQGPTDPTGKRSNALKTSEPQKEKGHTDPLYKRKDQVKERPIRKQCDEAKIGNHVTANNLHHIYDEGQRVQAIVPIERLDTLAKEEEIVLQACDDPSIIPLAQKVVGSMLTLQNAAGDHICYGLMVKGDLGTTVWHILPHYPGLKGVFAIDNKGEKYTLSVVEEHIVTDRIDFRLHPFKGVAQFPDITSHLAPANYKGFVGRECMLVNLNHAIFSKQKIPVVVMRSYRAQQVLTKHDEDIQRSVNLIEYIGHKAGYLSTGVQTINGDCGSLLIVSDSGHNEGKIIGLHSRANTLAAYSRPITREDYMVTDKEMGIPLIGRFQNLVTEVEENEDEVLAVTDRPVFHSTKTRLFQNVAPVGPRLYEPAILSIDDKRNPGHDLIPIEAEKWCVAPPELSLEDQQLLLDCATDLAMHYKDVMQRNHCKITTLTRMQALNKYKPAVHSEPIIIRTSPGFPWNQLAKEPGKMDYIQMDPSTGIRRFQRGILAQQLGESVNAYHRAASIEREHTYDPPIFQIFLKDEPTKLKNIYDVVKTRTIAAAPLHFQIVHRQYVHAALSAIMDIHNEVPVAVGINPNSVEWDMMFRQATSVGTSFVAMDYKGWDFTLHPFIIEKCLPLFYNIIYKHLDPKWKVEDDAMRNFIYHDIAHAHILIKNRVKKIKRGIVSGIPSTAVDNSIANDLQKFFVWKKQMSKVWPQLSGYDHYNRQVFRKYYGDDFFLALSDAIRDYFNGHIIKSIEEATFGTTLTAADKVSEVQKWQTFREITFMSRSFTIVDDRCIGRLEWERVCKPTHFVHDDRHHEYSESPGDVARNLEACFHAFESALIEAVHWGKGRFNQIRDAGQKAFNEYEYPFILPDFATIFAEVNGVPPPLQARHDFHTDDALDILHEIGLKKCSVPLDARVWKKRSTWHMGPAYSYTGAVHPSRPILPTYQKLLDAVNKRYGRNWNSLLFNEYSPGGEIPWHKDNEPEVDLSEGVGCLTVMGDGVIQLLRAGEQVFRRQQLPGSFYIMEETCLRDYQHRRIDHRLKTVSISFRRLSPKDDASS